MQTRKQQLDTIIDYELQDHTIVDVEALSCLRDRDPSRDVTIRGQTVECLCEWVEEIFHLAPESGMFGVGFDELVEYLSDQRPID